MLHSLISFLILNSNSILDSILICQTQSKDSLPFLTFEHLEIFAIQTTQASKNYSGLRMQDPICVRKSDIPLKYHSKYPNKSLQQGQKRSCKGLLFGCPLKASKQPFDAFCNPITMKPYQTVCRSGAFVSRCALATAAAAAGAGS